MGDRYLPLSPSGRILMGPGPSDVHPRVLAAMSMPLLGHLDPEFLRVMDETSEMLRQVFQTRNRLTIPVSGTGSAGMETCFVNLVEPGDEVVVCVNGVFGQRMVDVATRCGAKVTVVEAPWGRIIEPAQVARTLENVKPKLVALVHAETSTGVHQPVEPISRTVHEAGALLLLDTVTSLGGAPVTLDQWQVDACYSGTQKCLSCPPGLAPVSLSQAAMDVLHARRSKVQSWYLDMSMVERYWGQERFYHHTAPISMIYALREALHLILEEGLEARFERHRLNHEALKAGLGAMGITYAAQEGHQLPMLNAVTIPEGVDDVKVRRLLLSEFGIELGGGLGEFKGKVWRVGLMGHSSRRKNVLLLMAALSRALTAQGRRCDVGAALRAANQVYAHAAE